MDYSFMIDDMVWSYSRLSSFDDCKYGWYLKYIRHQTSDEPKFFATYGTFVHKVLELHLANRLTKEEAVEYYLDNYDAEVQGEAPSAKVARGFFEKSLDYLKNIDFPFPLEDIVTTEKKVRFQIDGHDFVGFIDVLAKRGNTLHIIDHKSHGLRNRSGRKFQTEYDKELDRYLKQQYLYAIPIRQEYGRFPASLNFNCYRHGRFITEKFNFDTLHKVKQWAVGQIATIRQERSWEPNPDAFRCKYICDSSQCCEYCGKK